MMQQALVNKIIDCSVVDGPGNRTVVFFQGCNLDCKYCHNPETIGFCTNCGACIASCPAKALSLVGKRVVWDDKKCIGCDVCLKTCTYKSSPKTKLMTAEDVVLHLRPNLPFIRGITLSGGECTLTRRDFIIELFAMTKALGLTNLLDSNGTLDFSEDCEILRDCDGVMLDIKAFDDSYHRKITGSPNELVLKNAVFLAKIGKLTEVRTVVIPGLLDNEGTANKTSQLLSPYLSVADIGYKLIKYRPFGVREEYSTFPVPDDALMQRLSDIVRGNGFRIVTVI
ncbi:MAG: YjjW family glycine radical enzyme activase [Oscillospiraceae bacterium]